MECKISEWWKGITDKRKAERNKAIYKIAKQEADKRIIISRDMDGFDYIFFDGVKITKSGDIDILARLNEIKENFIVNYHNERT